jgi:endonuclease/exonuclease/phosphatase (EEP) superfamily protein YafD
MAGAAPDRSAHPRIGSYLDEMRTQYRELYLATALLTAALVVAFAPDAYVPMLARAFILPTTIVTLLIALFAAFRKKWWVAQAALLGCAIMALQIQAPHVDTITTDADRAFRVFHMNVLQPNTAFDAAIAQALDSDADVISVQEVGPEWACALNEGLLQRCPFVHLEPRSNCYGIALFSKWPFQCVRTITVQGAPFIEAFLAVDGMPIRLLAVHATSPITYGHFRRRNEQLNRLSDHLAHSDTATILVGDLNTVPWDKAFMRFCSRSGLRSTTPMMQRTWPSIGPLAVIPLDHVLVSSGIRPVGLRTASVAGSDHRALIADLNLPHHAR